MLEALAKLRQVDKRLIYLVLAAVVILPFFVPFKLPIYPSPPAKGLYKAIESVPKDKLVLIGADWDASVKGELGPQTAAVINHLFARHQRFAIWGVAVQGPLITEQYCEKLAPAYGAEYGKDWVNLGYRTAPFNTLMAAVKDFPDTFKDDYRGQELAKLPVMKGIHNVNDLGLVITFSGSAVLGTYLNVLGPYKQVKLGCGVTAVIGPDYYPFLDSGQLAGLLVGLKGAAEYEALIDKPAQGTSSMNSQSLAHILIILLIILGNLGWMAQRKLEAQTEGRRAARGYR